MVSNIRKQICNKKKKNYTYIHIVFPKQEVEEQARKMIY